MAGSHVAMNEGADMKIKKEPLPTERVDQAIEPIVSVTETTTT